MTLAKKLAALHSQYAKHSPTVRALAPVGLASIVDAVSRKGEATLYLYDAIAAEGAPGISAKAFAAALVEARDARTLHVRINSVGGSVFEAKAMYRLLRESKAHKVVHVDGLAASAATFIAMAGDEIVTAPERA
jgi:ATP-dependent Clp protease protease subunit